jgi:hypothetical protein
MQDSSGLVPAVRAYEKAERINKIVGGTTVSLGCAMLFCLYSAVYSDDATDYVRVVERAAVGKCLSRAAEIMAQESSHYPLDEEIIFSTRMTGQDLKDCVVRKQQAATQAQGDAKDLFMWSLFGFLAAGFAFVGTISHTERKRQVMHDALDEVQAAADRYGVTGIGGPPINI